LIKQLYNLKKNQTEQKLTEKSALEKEVDRIEEEIESTQYRINTATVQKFGSISDFMVLAMHKDSLRFYIKELLIKKNDLLKKVEALLGEIIELQKQSEQYKYILEEQIKEKNKMLMDIQALEAEEFIQSKYIRS